MGLINKAILSRYLKDVLSPIYYIAGPPGMVKGLHTMLTEMALMMPTFNGRVCWLLSRTHQTSAGQYLKLNLSWKKAESQEERMT